MYEPTPPPMPQGWPEPPPAPPPLAPDRAPWWKPRRSMAYWTFIVCGLLVIGSSAGVAIAAQHPKSSRVTTAGAPSSTSTGGAATAAWASMVGADSATMSDDFTQFSTDAGDQDEAAVSADCQQILTDITGFQSDISGPPPARYEQANSLLARALQTYSDACNGIIASIASQDVSALSVALTEINTGNSLLQQALAASETVAAS